MDRFVFDDFPAEVQSELPNRVRNIRLYDADGKMLDFRLPHLGKSMKLSVYPILDAKSKKESYIGYFEGDEDDTVVVFGPGQYFTIE